MSGPIIPPVPSGGRPVGPQRVVPALPQGIPIMPGETTAARPKRRFPVVLILLIVLLVFAGLYAYPVFFAFRNDYDTQRITPIAKRAILTHAKAGDRFPVTLRNGPRILRIDFSTVQPGAQRIGSAGPDAPTTCVSYTLLDPKTGVADNSSRYAHVSCIEGIAYRIAP
jgi:hypothetical protein